MVYRTKKINSKINDNNKTKKIRPYIPFEKYYMDALVKNKKYKCLKDENIKLMKEIALKYKGNKASLPENDFYTYVNSRWLENEELFNTNLNKQQKYIAQVDDFRLVQDNVFSEINTIINDYIKNNKNKKSQCLKNYFESASNLMSKEKSTEYINYYINYIDEMRKDKKNLWKLLAEVNKNEIIKSQAPFVWNVVPNRKNSKFFISEISPHTFVLLNFDAYFEDNEERKSFNQYIKKIFEIAKVDIGNPYDVLKCGIDMFNSFGCDSLKQDPNNYNLVKADESLEKYGFDWITFAKELGYKTVPEEFVVTDVNYLKCCCKVLNEKWDSEQWRTLWIWLFTRKIIAYTNGWDKVYFEYYAKIQRGIDVENLEVRPALFTSLAFNTTITEQYVKRNYNEEKVDYIRGFIEDLKLVFIRIIQNNKWMSPNTKKYALLKLEHLKFNLVKPDNLFSDPLLDYISDDYIGNVEKLMFFRTKRYISLDGKKLRNIPSMDWNQYPPKFSSYQCYIVNAMYIPTSNSIYIPLGYIQEPFIDLNNRGIEYNLSNIGFTICHEMSHCLDDSGSKYDYEGNLKDWWTTQDKKKFKKIQENILKQYNSWAKRDGLKFDATSSLGEDLADISALYICDIYLLDFNKSKKALTPVIANSFNTFHVYFASQQKQKISKLAEKAQLLTNPHPPNKYRCNVPMSRSFSFISNYKIKKGDEMYWHNVESIW
jgi:putative endopeptidase